MSREQSIMKALDAGDREEIRKAVGDKPFEEYTADDLADIKKRNRALADRLAAEFRRQSY